MKITADIFGAILKCPTKCWLRAKGEEWKSNTYQEWMTAKYESYRATKTGQLQLGLRVQSLTPSSALYFTSYNRWRYLIGPYISANVENFRKINKRARDHKLAKALLRPNKLISFEATKCPSCRSGLLIQYGESCHDILDLRFTNSGSIPGWRRWGRL